MWTDGCRVYDMGFNNTLDIVSMATGEVIPSSQVKTIQHLEGGIVREIHVREGESVREGQLLMKLSPQRVMQMYRN